MYPNCKIVNLQECAVVTVVEHTSCGCDCNIRAEQCSASGQHVFRPELCACECRDVQAKRQCLEEGRTWSEDTCTCGCPLSTLSECQLGYVFDYNKTCSCVPNLGLLADDTKLRLSGTSDTDIKELDTFLTWETILIIVLGSLLIILSMIVLGLMIRLRSLRKKADSHQSLVPSTLSGQYFPCADPCSDLSATGQNGKKLKTGSLSDSDSDRGKILTDSSLCSEQERDGVYQWTDSSDSLHPGHPGHPGHNSAMSPAANHYRNTSPCLESVNLNSNLAIRCNDNCSIYSGSGGGAAGVCRPCSNQSAAHSDTYNTYSTLKKNSNAAGNYNSVKIVYTNGDRSTELTCLMDPNNAENPSVNTMYNITPNPMNVYSM